MAPACFLYSFNLIGKYFALTIIFEYGIFENRERVYPKIHSFSKV